MTTEGGRVRSPARRFAAAALAFAVCAALAVPVSNSGAAGGGGGCAHQGSLPNQTSIPRLRAATLCLLNKARQAKGVDRLDLNVHLTRMANRHSRKMVTKHCFKHTCPGEDPLPKRLQTSGYLAGAQNWVYAEDLGFESTPKQMVGRWLQTKFDRKSILSAKFADAGLGLAVGSPRRHESADKKFVTYTLDLARRTPPA